MGYFISNGPIPKKSEHKPGPKKQVLGRAHFDALQGQKLHKKAENVHKTAKIEPKTDTKPVKRIEQAKKRKKAKKGRKK